MKETEVPAITAIGAFTPDRLISNSYIAERLGRPIEVLQRLMRKVGIESRRWASEDMATSDMAIRAVANALEMSGDTAQDLKAIWVATMSGDHPGVPVAPTVQNELGAPNMGTYLDIGAACAGFVGALNIAYTNLTSRFGVSGPQAVVGADILSRSISPANRDTFVLFGDAAGAVIVRNVPDKMGISSKVVFQTGADGLYAQDLVIPAGGSRHPTTRQTIESDMHDLRMNGPVVKEQAIRRMVECVEILKERANVSFDDIRLFIPHQANLEIIDAVTKSLGFPKKRVYKNIDRYGNTSAASIPIAMCDAHREGKLAGNELVMMAAFGAGFEFAASIVYVAQLPAPRTASKVRTIIMRKFSL